MSSHVSTNNELLTLWLKASGGLPADEARELIERLATMEVEHAAEIETLLDEHEAALDRISAAL
jgi:rubrerythrin